MKNLLFLLILSFCMPSTWAQKPLRSIYIKGEASKKILADEFFIFLEIKIHNDCDEIPEGKNFKPQMESCQQKFKITLQQRLDSLKELAKVFSPGLVEEIEEYKYGIFEKPRFRFFISGYSNYAQFILKIKENKEFYEVILANAQSSAMNREEFFNLKVDALGNAQLLAAKHAKILDCTLDSVRTIYGLEYMDKSEYSDINEIYPTVRAGGYLNESMGLKPPPPPPPPSMPFNRARFYSNYYSNSTGLYIPDDNGNIMYESEVYVVFSLK